MEKQQIIHDYANHNSNNNNIKNNKKWSLGSFFRRKKKDDLISESSSEEDRKAGFLPTEKRKPFKSKRIVAAGGFGDQIIINGKHNSLQPYNHITNRKDLNSTSLDQQLWHDNVNYADRRHFAKENSGDISPFRSDESLGTSSSGNKKSRSARTERYLKRMSKGEELQPIKSNFNCHENSRQVYASTNCLRNSSSLTNVPMQNKENHLKSNLSMRLPNQNYENYLVRPSPTRDVQFSSMPPAPPPRDPQRRFLLNNGAAAECRPVSYNFDQNNLLNNGLRNSRCVSDDKLSRPFQKILPQRPASVQPIGFRKFYAEQPPGNFVPDLPYREYKYSADLTPRSRRPIHLVSDDVVYEGQKSMEMSKSAFPPSPMKSAANFWKKIDRAESLKRHTDETIKSYPIGQRTTPNDFYRQENRGKPKDDLNENIVQGSLCLVPSKSCIFSAKSIDQPTTHHYSIIERNKSNSLPSAKNHRISLNPLNKYEEHVAKTIAQPILPIKYNKVPPKSPVKPVEDSAIDKRKKSKNLEDSINELEAIYKSLRLGDANLVEKYNFVPDTDSSRIEFDKNEDEENDVISSADVLLDDVVYRNLKRANSIPKTVISQPPFGIPVGPIPAISHRTDYLQISQPINRQSISSSKSPDLVADDLAVRNLRKENAILARNQQKLDQSIQQNVRKKSQRAVRSMSENICDLITKNAAKPSGGDLESYDRIYQQESRNSLDNINEASTKDHPSTLFVLQRERDISRLEPPVISTKNRGAVFNLPSTMKTSPVELYPKISISNNRSAFAQSHPTVGFNPSPNLLARSGSSDEIIQHESGMEDLLNAISREAKENSEKISQELLELRREVNNSKELNKQLLCHSVDQKVDSPTSASTQDEPISAAAIIVETKLEKLDKPTDDDDATIFDKINENIAKIKSKITKSSETAVSSLLEQLEPSSMNIGAIADRCMKQISTLGELDNENKSLPKYENADYDNLNSNSSLPISKSSFTLDQNTAPMEEEIDIIMKECFAKVASTKVSKEDEISEEKTEWSDAKEELPATVTIKNSPVPKTHDFLEIINPTVDPIQSPSIPNEIILPQKALPTTTIAAESQPSQTHPNISPSPSPAFTASQDESQYNSAEELAMIFGLDEPVASDFNAIKPNSLLLDLEKKLQTTNLSYQTEQPFRIYDTEAAAADINFYENNSKSLRSRSPSGLFGILCQERAATVDNNMNNQQIQDNDDEPLSTSDSFVAAAIEKDSKNVKNSLKNNLSDLLDYNVNEKLLPENSSTSSSLNNADITENNSIVEDSFPIIDYHRRQQGTTNLHLLNKNCDKDSLSDRHSPEIRCNSIEPMESILKYPLVNTVVAAELASPIGNTPVLDDQIEKSQVLPTAETDPRSVGGNVSIASSPATSSQGLASADERSDQQTTPSSQLTQKPYFQSSTIVSSRIYQSPQPSGISLNKSSYEKYPSLNGAAVVKDVGYLKKNKRLSDVSRKMDALKERTKSELANIEKITEICHKQNVAKVDSLEFSQNKHIYVDENQPITKRKTNFIEIVPNENRNTVQDDAAALMQSPTTSSNRSSANNRKRSASTEGNYTFTNRFDKENKNAKHILSVSDKQPASSSSDHSSRRSFMQRAQDLKGSEENVTATNQIVSILKKSTDSSSNNTSPVTFSSNTLDTPTRTSSPKQGILKKRSSLDESRYYSSNHSLDESRINVSMLRRNSLEEIQHGILKQRSYEYNSEQSLVTEPQSILKKKETSTPNNEPLTKNVSISEAVFLATAQLNKDSNYTTAENIEYDIRPILKQDTPTINKPRPILKKMFSSDAEEIRPILKGSRKSSREESVTDTQNSSDDNYRFSRRKSMDFAAKKLISCDIFEPNSVLERCRSLDQDAQQNSNSYSSLPPVVAAAPTTFIEKPIISVAERVKYMENSLNKTDNSSSRSPVAAAGTTANTPTAPKRFIFRNRFNTQPVTTEEICSAKTLIVPRNQPDTQSSVLSRSENAQLMVKLNELSDTCDRIALDDPNSTFLDDTPKNGLSSSVNSNNNTKNRINLFKKLENNQLLRKSISIEDKPKLRNLTKPILPEKNIMSSADETSDFNSPDMDATNPDNVKPKAAQRVLPIDLSAELRSRLQKSPHASVRNLKKSSSSIDATLSSAKPSMRLPNVDLSMLNKKKDDVRQDLGNLLRCVSKENMKNVGVQSAASGGAEDENSGESILKKIMKIREAERKESNDSNGNISSIKPSLFKLPPLRPPPTSSSNNDTAAEDPSNVVNNNENLLPHFLKGGIKHSFTEIMRPEKNQVVKDGGSIADRLAALQRSGEDDWRRRVSNKKDETDNMIKKDNILNQTTNLSTITNKDLDNNNKDAVEKSISGTDNVLIRLEKIKNSSEGWRNRVSESDAAKFTVAGRLQQSKTMGQMPFQKPDTKMTPSKQVLRSLNQAPLGLAKSPSMIVPVVLSSKNASLALLTRSNSAPGDNEENKQIDLKSIHGDVGPKVAVHKIDDDETFLNFFNRTKHSPMIIEECSSVDIADFDSIKTTEKLRHKKTVQGPKNRRPAKNPLKVLANRIDLQNEYTEIKTGVAEKELNRLKMESMARTYNLAVEAVAGLSSIEDFKSVNLKSTSLPLQQSWLPYKKTKMLLHIKGRTHIQTRLVQPTYASVNRGDCFILVTPRKLYRFVGHFANVIEKSRSKIIAASIIENKDLGCSATRETVIQDGKDLLGLKEFWDILEKPDDLDDKKALVEAGHADEDDLFESCLIETNMIYEFMDDTLVPMEQYWGSLLKYEMLDPNKVIIFNFGAEVYVWNGKNAKSDAKRGALRLAQELFQSSFDYETCHELNPMNFSALAGERSESQRVTNKNIRSGLKEDWCLLAKITQHMETILFREKFIDWPEYERDELEKDYLRSNRHAIKPLDGELLFEGEPYAEPNLCLENANLGRGNSYYDVDTMRHFDILTDSISKWQINEFTFSEIDSKLAFGHFYADESYIIRWIYRISCTVRELTGEISNRNTVGRDRCVYFCWQGKDANANEKGTASLLTVELDKEKGSQMRVQQGEETTAFIRLFDLMFIHRGRKAKSQLENYENWRLYSLTGNDTAELLLIELECSRKNLRSRASIILVNGRKGEIFVWHGCKSLQHTQEMAKRAATKMQSEKYPDLITDSVDNVKIVELFEGQESDEFNGAIGSSVVEHFSLVNSVNQSFDFTPRLFQFSSTNGRFEAVELLSSVRTKDLSTPYPFQQSILYGARQPTIFMIDNGDMLWIWQGWWPKEDGDAENEDDVNKSTDNRAGELRWQSERCAAIQTTVSYWEAKQSATLTPNNNKVKLSRKSSNSSTSTSDSTSSSESAEDESNCPIQGRVIWAGLEPLEFQSIFPEWIERNDIKKINIQDGRSEEDVTIVDALAQLTQKEHPLSVLLTRPLPEGCDPTRLEIYLSETDFVPALGITRNEFEKMTLWKQKNLKKERGLF